MPSLIYKSATQSLMVRKDVNLLKKKKHKVQKESVLSLVVCFVFFFSLSLFSDVLSLVLNQFMNNN